LRQPGQKKTGAFAIEINRPIKLERGHPCPRVFHFGKISRARMPALQFLEIYFAGLLYCAENAFFVFY
jgi:hypothetical protein